MALLFTSLCRVGGEELYHRLDQPVYSVLPRPRIDPNTVLAGGAGGYGPDARHPGFREQPRRLLRAEGADEVLDRRAGGEGDAGHLIVLQSLRQLIPFLEGGYGLVGRRDDDRGARFAEPLGQDLARHAGAGDEDLLPRERVAGHLLDQGLRPELSGHHIHPQAEISYPLRRRRADGRYSRVSRHGPQVQPVVREPPHERLDAVYAREDQPREGVEIADGGIQRFEVLGGKDLDGRELQDHCPEPL